MNAWLEEGLRVLAESGHPSLTIDLLAERLHLTKGSFYHHFNSRQDYTESLLSYWEKQMTLDIIEATEKIGENFADRNAALIRLSRMDQNSNLEVAIRAWALSNSLVRKYQQRVDKIRLDYLEKLFGMLTHDKETRKRMALIRYCMYVGTQQVLPKIRGETLSALYHELHRMLERKAEANPSGNIQAPTDKPNGD